MRASLNRLNWLGNQISRFTEFSLLEHRFGSLAPFVLVLSHSESDLYSIFFFFWIPDSLRKVLKNFESLSQLAELVRKPDQPVTEFNLLKQQFGSLVPFVSVLNHSELVFYLICFFGFLTLRGRL